jgi:hypothetical protein
MEINVGVKSDKANHFPIVVLISTLAINLQIIIEMNYQFSGVKMLSINIIGERLEINMIHRD